MRVISDSLSLIWFSILRISIGVALAAMPPVEGPGVLSRAAVPSLVVVAGSLPGVAVALRGLAGCAPPPIVERVLEAPRIFEPARLFERLIPVAGCVDMAGLVALAAVAAFFSSYCFKAAAAVR